MDQRTLTGHDRAWHSCLQSALERKSNLGSGCRMASSLARRALKVHVQNAMTSVTTAKWTNISPSEKVRAFALGSSVSQRPVAVFRTNQLAARPAPSPPSMAGPKHATQRCDVAQAAALGDRRPQSREVTGVQVGDGPVSPNCLISARRSGGNRRTAALQFHQLTPVAARRSGIDCPSPEPSGRRLILAPSGRPVDRPAGPATWPARRRHHPKDRNHAAFPAPIMAQPRVACGNGGKSACGFFGLARMTANMRGLRASFRKRVSQRASRMPAVIRRVSIFPVFPQCARSSIG